MIRSQESMEASFREIGGSTSQSINVVSLQIKHMVLKGQYYGCGGDHTKD